GSIPKDIHDAAAVDGAGFWRHYFQVTLPLILPISLVAILFGLIFTFTDMVIIYNLTRGGPYDTTQVLASLAFYTGIAGGDLAEGAAIALFLFPLLLAVAFGFLRVARRTEVICSDHAASAEFGRTGWALRGALRAKDFTLLTLPLYAD